MRRLRIALFGSSSNFTERALHELALRHDVVGLAIPSPARGFRAALRGLLRGAGSSALEAAASARGVSIVEVAKGEVGALAERLRRLRPDLICIALHPWLLPAAIVEIAPLGAINAHPSLLPRHRGPLPLFWTYHADDRVAGVTVHRAAGRFDAGEVLFREQFDLPRGYPVARLDQDVTAIAGPLLARAAVALADGTVTAVEQDEAAATQAPFIRAGEPMARFEEWDVERAWHFLAALCPVYREPLRDDAGLAVDYSRVIGYRRGESGPHRGVVERAGGKLSLRCRGGCVELA
jgi:methionyl-tRNA formyltransferase